MNSYLAAVPVKFTDGPSKAYLSDLNEALAEYDPRGAEGQLFWSRNDDGTIMIRVVIEASDEKTARDKARETVNSALLDTGHTVATVQMLVDSIEVSTWQQ
ncbi:hypothetical protein [Streptomyces californicus]|uniref:hypothetical protein n=1 Tax=Streptomyces californicus TaxID=67351 RepID=UPI0033A39286